MKLNIIYYIWAISSIILYYIPINLSNTMKSILSVLGLIIAFILHVALEKAKEHKKRD